jgi:agmatinase
MSTPSFDPDAAALEGTGIFGLPQNSDTALVHVVRVPFDATTSYRKGAAFGPDAVERASRQVELFDPLFGKPYLRGIFCGEADPRIGEWNGEASDDAEPIIAAGGAIGDDKRLLKRLARVNELGQELNEHVRAAVSELLAREKLPCVLGGDHSVPFGAIQACAERHPGLGVLHFDAHADLREAYEGFTWSHASIMHNVSERIGGVAKLVQVGIRDFGEREYEHMQGSKGRIETLFDAQWQQTKLDGGKLRELARSWIAKLPNEVYVSFDIDGLDPVLCPNTGTPVPGGLGWAETLMWLEELARSKKRIVGLDLNEVSPGPDADSEIDSWDAIVGARLLYRMIGSALASR